ncbi:MAG: heterocyst differentiation related protein [Heteroscytonema crispum UTEX LB 1556]
MSESMAFIGGVAVAGLAALVLLKGTGTPLQPNIAVAPQMPAVVAPQIIPQQGQYSAYGQSPYLNTNPSAIPPNSDSLRLEMERQKMQLERLQADNDQLKAQNQQLQFQVQTYNNQQAQFSQSNNASQKAALEPSQIPWWSSPIVWAVGGMTLTIGGGIVVAGVLALFSPKQRSTRTVQVIHPYHGPTPPLAPVRRAEFLPPRGETRRTEATEYDEMH